MAKKILIADDQEIIAEMVGLRLEEKGYKILLAYSGQEVLNKVQSEKPDLILMDLGLPKIRGDEVSRRLKADEKYRHIPIILMTAYPRDQIQDTGAADEFLGKPYDADELFKKIGKFLG